MPGYKTHRAISIPIGLGTAVGSIVVQEGTYRLLEQAELMQLPENHLLVSALTGILIGLGAYYGGTLGSPDLDIPSMPYNSWKKLRLLWLPWQILVKHRSPLSHWPILGSISSATYLLLLISILVGIFMLLANACAFALRIDSYFHFKAYKTAMSIVWSIVLQRWFWLFVLGDIIGKTGHDITDFLDRRRRIRYQGSPVPPIGEEEPDKPNNIWER